MPLAELAQDRGRDHVAEDQRNNIAPSSIDAPKCARLLAQAMAPAPLAPPGSNAVGPRNPLKNCDGPAGPTGPTANEVPDVVRAVFAAFEPSAGGDQASQQPPEPSQPGPDLEFACDLVEERAAIREHDGGQDRAQAEAAALHEVAASMGLDTGQLRRALASGKTH